MFEKIAQLFKKECSVTKMKDVLVDVDSLLNHFTADYVKDGSAFNAAIDAVCEMLQGQKK